MIRDAARADLAAECLVIRKLWRAVLVHALREAKGQVVNVGGAYTPAARQAEVRRACDWVGSRDFREVCEMAGVTLSRAEVFAALDGPKGDLLIRKTRHT